MAEEEEIADLIVRKEVEASSPNRPFRTTSAGYPKPSALRVRPTAFISIHVDNPKPAESMHITVMLTAFKKEQMDKAKEALEATAAEFRAAVASGGLTLTFRNFGVFNRCILFAEVHEDGEKTKLHRLKEIASAQFAGREFPLVGDERPFHPHMSLPPLNKAWKHLEKKPLEFGVQDVKSLRLCAMGLNRETRDYTTLHEVSLVLEEEK
ncbi:A-kinase anchor protein 7-like isoform X2 [Aphelenchoides fujianensis]|nr:A-kinase anchor protein 7-like isoform X2 [Aphelenchoides fujianensis]